MEERVLSTKDYALTNEQLQHAITALLVHFSSRESKRWRREWCGTHAPDGALSQALAELLWEQTRRAKY